MAGLLKSFPQNYHAVIVGVTGGIGSAIYELLEADGHAARVTGLSRSSTPAIDFEVDGSVKLAAEQIAEIGPVHLLIDATGFLSDQEFKPEKSLRSLNLEQFQRQFLHDFIDRFVVTKRCAQVAPSRLGILVPKLLLSFLSNVDLRVVSVAHD